MSRPYSFVKFVSGSEFLSTRPTELFKRRSDCENGTMSGDEAKTFYESVVSVSSTSSCGGNEITNESSSHPNFLNGDTEKVGSKRKTALPGSSSANDNFLSTKHRGSKRRKRKTSTTQERMVNEFLRSAQNGNIKQLRELIHETDLDINTTDRFSWSGLMCAAQEGHILVVELLLKFGALWEDIRDANGRNALDLAELSGHQNIVDLLKQQREQTEMICEGKWPACSNTDNGRKAEKFWCTVCQQEFTDSQRKHKSSTIHLFNCQHEPKRTFYYIPEGNVGYQMMLKSGWKEEKGLGPEGEGRKFPVKTVLKRDRSGLGTNTSKGARVTHFGPGDESAVKGRKAKRDKSKRKPRKISKKEKRAQEKSERMWEKNLRIYMNTE